MEPKIRIVFSDGNEIIVETMLELLEFVCDCLNQDQIDSIYEIKENKIFPNGDH